MLIQADALYLPYPSNYFHAIVTSPPYWGLRKYAGDQGIITGGDRSCEHEFDKRKYYTMRGAGKSGSEAFSEAGEDNAQRIKDSRWNEDSVCAKCGAYRAPLGLEATPERHIERMVEVFREVWRVLRPDGVCWLNYGDCYGGSGGGHKDNTGQSGLGFSSWEAERGVQSPKAMMPGNLMLMPHRLAIALQADGWIVRNDLVWFKRNPMPESVAGWRWERKKIKTGRETADWDDLPKGWDVGEGSHDAIGQGNYRENEDRERTVATFEYSDDYVLRKSSWRHTRAHEYVFMLCKSMKYFCNQEAVREEALPASHKRASYGYKHIEADDHNRYGDGFMRSDGKPITLAGRNPRSVLDVPTAPYKGAHYATFPPKLIAPLIRASVPRRCCPECGMAWAPVVDRTFIPQTDVSLEKGIKGADNQKPAAPENRWDGTPRGTNENTVTDYRPTCECGVTEHEPGIVLDIFGGSGTTGMVAKELLRRWVVMDISRPYLDEQSKIRTRTGTPSKTLEGLPLFEDLE